MTSTHPTSGLRGEETHAAAPLVAANQNRPRVPRPIAFNELREDAQALTSEAPPLVKSVHPLHGVKATLQVNLGSATLTVGELLSAKEEQVVRLDRTLDQPVDLVLDGLVVARGQLVAVGDHFAVRITELPVALDLDKTGAA